MYKHKTDNVGTAAKLLITNNVDTRFSTLLVGPQCVLMIWVWR